MRIQRAAPVNELLARLIFLILPTALIGYFLLHGFFEATPSIKNIDAKLALVFTAGMAGSMVFYAFRFRFLPTFFLFVLAEYLFYKGLDNMSFGEFDSFFVARYFQQVFIVLTVGALIGWGFLRVRFFSIIMATLLLCGCVLVIAHQHHESGKELMWTFAPIALYSVYIIFTAEQIYSFKDKSQPYWWFLTRRLGAFAILAGGLLGLIIWHFKDDINATVANFGGGGKAGASSMLRKNKDNTFDLKDYSRLQSSLARNNELLFCAHIDNYFEGTDVPNPLYLTAFYYTKFDTSTETFERDSTIPQNDLFEPDPGSLGLFATQEDPTVLTNSGTERLGKEVDIEVYSKQLSSHTYLAPHTGYFVQPITVEKDFRDSFKTAFRAKSYVSQLNSAYFVYNVKDPEIKKFQAKRFEILRKVTDYSQVDKGFMKYYTYMPADARWDRIRNLATTVTAKAQTPVDKVIAIRDWFLSKDPSGQPLFKYTDNPGVPGLPSASKLQYFMFENHKGYCAYFAGATLFMLRSMGIPSRIAVGFLTEDRSGGKNKGWYWYYADQAHAWVQVYFPGYGWLDFDTTVGNDDARSAPKTDGTPPMQPPKAWFVADGIVQNIDTAKKLMTLKVHHMVFHDKEYKFQPDEDKTLDVHIATVRRDSVEVPLVTVTKGEEATAVSYADALKNMEANSEEGSHLLQRIPTPTPVDEIYVKRKETKAEKDKPAPVEKDTAYNWRRALWAGAIVLCSLLFLFFLLPSVLYVYYRMRYNNAKGADKKAYWAYRTASYYLNQLGIVRGTLTPMQYAMRVVDASYGTQFTRFMNVYLKQKYAKQPLTESEAEYVSRFLRPFIGQVAAKHSFFRRLGSFLNPLRSIIFFTGFGEDGAV